MRKYFCNVMHSNRIRIQRFKNSFNSPSLMCRGVLELKPHGLHCAYLELTVPYQAILFGCSAGQWLLSQRQIQGIANGIHSLVPHSHPSNRDWQLPQHTWGAQNVSWSLTGTPKYALYTEQKFIQGRMLCSMCFGLIQKPQT
jgi:hypothetical protein